MCLGCSFNMILKQEIAFPPSFSSVLAYVWIDLLYYIVILCAFQLLDIFSDYRQMYTDFFKKKSPLNISNFWTIGEWQVICQMAQLFTSLGNFYILLQWEQNSYLFTVYNCTQISCILPAWCLNLPFHLLIEIEILIKYNFW